MILVTGFGPFLDVHDNPSARLARQVHGRVAGRHRVVGAVLPVRWDAVPDAVLGWVRRVRPVLVVGTGVARGRTGVHVECVARPLAIGDDVAGRPGAGVLGPEARGATIDTQLLADALGATCSQDAGTYLCNAWLYQVPACVDAPAGFVHLPPVGLDPDRLLDALAALSP